MLGKENASWWANVELIEGQITENQPSDNGKQGYNTPTNVAR